ncbi:MAG: ATP-binding protein [Candidatus Cloacimonetes bacterium]|nr:ATP-binding protein [Candidatus Cloacimonadota bacterium]
MKLTVDNFISIKRAELELNNITLIIGEQAEGKSLLAKLVYYFLMLIENPFLGRDRFDNISECIKEYKKEFQNRFYYQDNDFFNIKFEIDSNLWYFLKYDSGNGLQLEISKAIGTFITKHIRLNNSEKELFIDNIKRLIKYKGEIQQLFGSINYKKALFIDSARSYYGILEKTWLPLIKENIKFADPFLFEYGDLLQKAKAVAGNEKFRNWGSDNKVSINHYNNILKLLSNNILKGDYRAINGDEYIISGNERKTMIANTSSGQKETLPIVLILKALISNDIYDYMRFKEIIIEEPESHVFPSTQKDLVDFISFVYKLNDDNHFLITTHSPYILTAFNNLILAGETYNDADQKVKNKIAKIMVKECLLRSKEVTAYHLESGVLKPIMDKETGLILAEGLDKVSEDIGEQFSQLLDLD